MIKLIALIFITSTSLLITTGCGHKNKRYEKTIAQRYDDRIEENKMKLFKTKEYRE